MNPDLVIDLSREALQTAVIVALPVLGVALLVGFAVTTLQSMTQIQDQTIATVCKFVAVILVLLFAMPWLIETMTSYSSNLIERVPESISGQP